MLRTCRPIRTLCFFTFLLVAAPSATVGLADVEVALVPVQDAFVREQAPTLNYGSAGALNIAGPDAMNGRFETVMQFDTSGAQAAFDAAFGVGGWDVRAARLDANENGAPFNPIFGQGLGDFEIRWLSVDNWVEGSGTPSFAYVGTGNEMTWELLQTILSAATESSLGSFSNALSTSPISFNLGASAPFVLDIHAGGLLSLHCVPTTATIGFTFNSRNYFIESNHPRLILTAASTRGDLNCDGQISNDDIAAFTLALLDPAAYAQAFQGCNIQRADFNEDGLTNGDDIAGFVAALPGI